MNYIPAEARALPREGNIVTCEDVLLPHELGCICAVQLQKQNGHDLTAGGASRGLQPC